LDLRGRKWQENGEDPIMREIHNLYASPHIIRVIKSGRMSWVEHVARIGETRNQYTVFVGKLEGKT
jgi:hypothetical protein